MLFNGDISKVSQFLAFRYEEDAYDLEDELNDANCYNNLEFELLLSSEEERWNDYFSENKEVDDADYCAVIQFRDLFCVTIYTNCEMEYRVFDSREEAVAEMRSVIDQYGYKCIQSVIQEFNKLNLGVEVVVKKEHDNGGHFGSFDIYRGEVMLCDGLFELDRETVEKSLAALASYEEEKGIHVLLLIKQSSSGDFTKWYQIGIKDRDGEFHRSGFDCTPQTGCYQGVPRSLFIDCIHAIDVSIENYLFDMKKYEDEMER